MTRSQAVILTVVLIGVTAWLAYAGQFLKTEAAPDGIVSFELAGDAAASARILDSWSSEARDMALLIQGVDYLYLFVYPLWLYWACTALARRIAGAWSSVGTTVAAMVLVATPLDAIENYALIMQLLDGPDDRMAQLAYWTAVPKFAAVFLAIGFVVTALSRLAVVRIRR